MPERKQPAKTSRTMLKKTELRRSHLDRSRRVVWEITDETGREEPESELDRILFDLPEAGGDLQDSIDANMDSLFHY